MLRLPELHDLRAVGHHPHMAVDATLPPPRSSHAGDAGGQARRRTWRPRGGRHVRILRSDGACLPDGHLPGEEVIEVSRNVPPDREGVAGASLVQPDK